MTEAAVSTHRAAVRAGILVTGTEVLTGAISDRNGPWLSERLAELGVDVAMIEVVGDRPADLEAALWHMAQEGVAMIVTSGGLGPTADDLTAEIVARFAGRELVLDPGLEQRIADIVRPLMSRWPGVDADAIQAANRKQAVVPEGATVLDPVGTAPGLVVPPTDTARAPADPARAPADAPDGPEAVFSRPTVVVLPGPPRELHAMWTAAVDTDAFRTAIAGATEYRRGILRLFGIPEAEIANALRAAASAGVELERLEVTTCLRRAEIEVSTRYEPADRPVYDALVEFIAARHPDTLFSRDGTTIDEQVAALLAGETIAVAESCTGGLLAARLTDRPGSSAYVAGGIVAYSNAAKVSLAGVDEALIESFGAVSLEVAEALAAGARVRFAASVGVGVTGVAGPGGGTDSKPVGLVCFSVQGPRGGSLTRSSRLPGDRAEIRERATTVAMHMIASVLRRR